MRSDVSYENDNDIKAVINKFINICGVIHKTVEDKKRYKYIFYKTLQTITLPALTNSSEIWVIMKSKHSKTQSDEMKYFRKFLNFVLQDKRRNENIIGEL